METTVKQRLIAFIKFKHLTQRAFEDSCGMSHGYVANIRKSIGSEYLASIAQQYPELNRDWLLYGEGTMLKPTNSGDITITGNNNSHIGHGNTSTNCENCNCETSTEAQELQGAPVIPTALCREGGCDILEYIEENPEEVEISPIRAKGVTIDLWWRIRATDNSNAPTYLPGDNIALASYPKGEERPRPGRFYVVDTYSNGFELGILFPTDSGDFRMQKKNREEFPDFTIERDDIIRIYRVIMMVRI
jgi:transcriptional regulator with XRE-family HTH domain